MIKLNTFLLGIALLISVASAGTIFQVGEPVYNYANAKHTTQVSFYFSLESGLPKSNNLVINLPSSLTNTVSLIQWTDACNTDLLQIPSASLFPAVHTLITSNKYMITFQKDDGNGTNIGKALTAMVPYQLIVTLNVIMTAGNYAPIGLKTISTSVVADYDKAIVYDNNPTFGSLSIGAEPAALNLTVYRVGNAADLNYIGSQFTGKIRISALIQTQDRYHKILLKWKQDQMKFVLSENCLNQIFGNLEFQQKLDIKDYSCEIQLGGQQMLIRINKAITESVQVIEFLFSALNTDQINSDFLAVYLMKEKTNEILAYQESATAVTTVFKTSTISLDDISTYLGWGVPYGDESDLFTLYQTTDQCINGATIHPYCVQVNSLKIKFKIVKQQLKAGLNMLLNFEYTNNTSLDLLEIFGSTFETNLKDKKDKPIRCDIQGNSITCLDLAQVERENVNELSFKLAIMPSATITLSSINLVIQFVDPAYPLQDPLAKLSHTMATQKVLENNGIDNKLAWNEALASSNTKNIGVQTQNDLTSTTWTLNSKISPSDTDQTLLFNLKAAPGFYTTSGDNNVTFALAMNPLMARNTTSSTTSQCASQTNSATPSDPLRCYLTSYNRTTYNYYTMDWMDDDNPEGTNVALDYAKAVFDGSGNDLKIGLSGMQFSFYNGIKVSQNILDFYVQIMDGNTVTGRLLFNTHMVTTSTTLYDKLTPAFVHWEIGASTTDGTKVPAFLKLTGYINDGESKRLGIMIEHGKPFYVPEASRNDPRQVACGSNKAGVYCYYEGNQNGFYIRENLNHPSLMNLIIIDFSAAQVSFDKPIEVYIPMRTDLSGTTLAVSNTYFKWNLVSLDSSYKQMDPTMIEFTAAVTWPTGGAGATPTDATKFVISQDTVDGSDPLLLGQNVARSVVNYHETGLTLTTSGTRYNTAQAALILCSNWNMYEQISTKVYKDINSTEQCVQMSYNQSQTLASNVMSYCSICSADTSSTSVGFDVDLQSKLSHEVYFTNMLFPITEDLVLQNTHIAVSGNTGNPVYFNEQGQTTTDPRMTGKQIVDLTFDQYILQKNMGGQSLEVRVTTQSPVPINAYFYLEAISTTIPFTIAHTSACELYHSVTPTTLISCTLSTTSAGISIQTSANLKKGLIIISLQGINLYLTSTPNPTAFNIRTCVNSLCSASTQIDDYQLNTLSGGDLANVQLGFTGSLTTKLSLEVIELLPLMKAQQGQLSFKIILDGQLILYSFEQFQIHHSLTYSGDPHCQITSLTGQLDFRFEKCYFVPNYLYITAKETISDLKDLIIVVQGITTPTVDSTGLYGKLMAGTNVIQELILNESVGFNMSTYNTTQTFQALTLNKKDSASLNTPGSLTFSIQTKLEVFDQGYTIVIHFPGYYDPQIGFGITCIDVDTGYIFTCSRKQEYQLQIINTGVQGYPAGTIINLKVQGVNLKFPQTGETQETTKNLWVGLFSPTDVLLVGQTVADKTSAPDIGGTVSHLDILNISLSNTLTMGVGNLIIEFNITDPSVLTPDANGIIPDLTVSFIYIDMPYFLYQGFLNTVTKDNVTVELMSDSQQQQLIKNVNISSNVIQIEITNGLISPLKGYKIMVQNFPTPSKPVSDDYRSQIGIRISKVLTGAEIPLYNSNRNYYNFIATTIVDNYIQLPINVWLQDQAPVSSNATRNLPDQAKVNPLLQPFLNFEIIQGIYSNKVCFKSTNNWSKKLLIKGQSSLLKTFPLEIQANHGESQSCFLMGSDDKTPKASYYLNFTKEENIPIIYQPVPPILVTVSTKTVEIKTPQTIQCVKGKKSLPIEISLDWPPFKNLVVSLKATSTSLGIDFTKVVPIEFSLNSRKGLLQFQCTNDAVAGQTVGLTKAGDSQTAYTFQFNEIKVDPITAPINSVSLNIKTDITPTANRYTLQVTCDIPGIVYYYNTLLKEKIEVYSLSTLLQRLDNPRSQLFEQSGYVIIDTAGQYKSIAFDTWADQRHSFQVYCQDIMDQVDYKQILHTSKSNTGTVQKLILNFDSAYFLQQSLELSTYFDDFLCFFAESLEKKYSLVKSFGGDVCSKLVGGNHKLPVTDIPPKKELLDKYFGDYTYVIYFLPDQTLETDTLKDDLQKWIFGPTFRSLIKNKFEKIDLLSFSIEQTTTVTPVQLGDTQILQYSNSSIMIKTGWQGTGFIYATTVEQKKQQQSTQVFNSTQQQSSIAVSQDQIQYWRQILDSKSPIYRGFVSNNSELVIDFIGLKNETTYDVYLVEGSENPDKWQANWGLVKKVQQTTLMQDQSPISTTGQVATNGQLSSAFIAVICMTLTMIFMI